MCCRSVKVFATALISNGQFGRPRLRAGGDIHLSHICIKKRNARRSDAELAPLLDLRLCCGNIHDLDARIVIDITARHGIQKQSELCSLGETHMAAILILVSRFLSDNRRNIGSFCVLSGPVTEKILVMPDRRRSALRIDQ